MTNDFKSYVNTTVTAMRPVTDKEISDYNEFRSIFIDNDDGSQFEVNISIVDVLRGSPKRGDMIAMDSESHPHLITKENFENLYKEL